MVLSSDIALASFGSARIRQGAWNETKAANSLAEAAGGNAKALMCEIKGPDLELGMSDSASLFPGPGSAPR